MRACEFLLEYDLKVSRDADGVAIKATAGGKQLGHAEFFFDEQGRLDPQTVWVDERFHRQGIAADMYDHLKSLGYTIIRVAVKAKLGHIEPRSVQHVSG